MTAVGDLEHTMATQAAKSGDTAGAAAWSTGGINSTLLHGLVGAATAALGGNALQGALGAGASETVSGEMQKYLIKQGVNPSDPLFNTLMQLGSAAVGGVVGGGAGAATALQGQLYNEQLHPNVVKYIVSLASTYAAENPGMSESEAQDILLRAAMSSNDSFDSRYLSQMDSSATQRSALQFLAIYNAVTPSGMLYNLSPSTADKNNSSLGAVALMNNQQAYTWVLQAMNPTGSPDSTGALTDYFDQISVDERVKDKFHSETMNFLNLNGQIALAAGSAGFLAGGSAFLAAANATRTAGTTGTAVGFAFATRGGVAVISGAVNAAAQLLDGRTSTGGNKPFQFVNVGVAAAAGYFGVGGKFWWNTAINGSGGFVQSELNNYLNSGEKTNVFTSALTSGVTGGLGYFGGVGAANSLENSFSKTLIPVLGGNVAAPAATEKINDMYNNVKSNNENDAEKYPDKK